MDQELTAEPRLTPPIPEAGISEILGTFTGKGELFSALEATGHIETPWSARDIERRAHRIYFQRTLPVLERLPRDVRRWANSLPAITFKDLLISPAPLSTTSWVDTRIRHGWPPTKFVGSERVRSADLFLVRSLKWVLDRIELITRDATFLDPSITSTVSTQLQVCSQVSTLPLLQQSVGEPPTKGDITAIRREGYPWTVVADISESLRLLDTSLEWIAHELIIPSGDLRLTGKLFQLAVLGLVLGAARDNGFRIVSMRPLTPTATGPAFEFIRQSRVWQIWFETGDIWSSTSIYKVATQGMGSSVQPLQADIVLLDRSAIAIVLECKYSSNRSYVASGIPQVLAYGTEVINGVAPAVEGYVVGPEGCISSPTAAHAPTGTYGIVDAPSLPALVREKLLA